MFLLLLVRWLFLVLEFLWSTRWTLSLAHRPDQGGWVLFVHMTYAINPLADRFPLYTQRRHKSGHARGPSRERTRAPQ